MADSAYKVSIIGENRLAAEGISSSGEIVRKQILMPIAEEAYQQQLIEIVKSIT
jgi:hypothetical protein